LLAGFTRSTRRSSGATLAYVAGWRVVRVFIQANYVTLAALGLLVVLDEVNMALHLVAQGDRIITNQVIMTLLGATTVQVGVIAAIIARYLFPGRPPDPKA
jgi:hypothetical protein